VSGTSCSECCEEMEEGRNLHLRFSFSLTSSPSSLLKSMTSTFIRIYWKLNTIGMGPDSPIARTFPLDFLLKLAFTSRSPSRSDKSEKGRSGPTDAGVEWRLGEGSRDVVGIEAAASTSAVVFAFAAAAARLALSMTSWCDGSASSPTLEGSTNLDAAVLSRLGRDVEGSFKVLSSGVSPAKYQLVFNIVSEVWTH
jgi:hypothetical protein